MVYQKVEAAIKKLLKENNLVMRQDWFIKII